MPEPMDPMSFAVVEPRIVHIAHELQRLLSLVELEKDGEPVQVDGFRLRDLSTWQDYAASSAMNALLPISGVCNSRCRFCFEQRLPFPRELSLMSAAEAGTRLKYYSQATGKCLFPSNRPQMETFAHPQALEIIEMARLRDPDAVFWLTTNGSYLDERTVVRLALLKPLMLKLSLNVADPKLHQQLMGVGERTPIAIEAPRLLRQYRIPFIGGIVAWPTLPLEAIEDTVGYLADCQAYAIRIRLPLTHRWLREQLDCDFRAHWDRIALFARQLRSQYQVPLIVEPPIYWMDAIKPEVDGIVLNSPAHRAGLGCGDIIRSINGQPVKTRTASEVLLYHTRAKSEPVDLVVKRGDEDLAFHLEDLPGVVDTYPYDPGHWYKGESLGVLHLQDFRLKYTRELFEIIDSYGASHVLLFSSPIVAPIFEAIVNNIPEYAERLERITIHLGTVKENTLGGNFDLMDSRFVEDYARVLRERLEQGTRIDLILIPDAFGSPWGMDLFGASISQLEMEFGIPVELIDWYLVYGPDV